MKNRRIFLVGPMGAGKSTVGRRLAGALDLRFFDLDEVLGARAGATIQEIFDIEGEAGFRRREAVLLDEYTRLPDAVLATGGGCILVPDNREILAERGFVVFLRTPVNLQLQRLRRDRKRPLLRTPDRRARLESLAAERDPLYERVADLVVEGRKQPPGRACEEILSLLPSSLGNPQAGAQS